MPTITRKIDLTPGDIVRILQDFSREEWLELKREMRGALAMEEVDADEFAEMLAWLYQEEPDPLPQDPPATAQGDQIALDAVNRMAGSIPITNPELGRWLAESPDLLLHGN